VRYLLLTAHYRESFNFTLDGLQGARTALGRIDECLGKLAEIGVGVEASPTEPAIVREFADAMDDDFNVAAAWGAVFEWVRETNIRLVANKIAADEAKSLLAGWSRINSVLGLPGKKDTHGELDPSLQKLLDERGAARKAKDFKRSDAIRDELKAKGWVIEDTPKGARLKRI
jgi:cysteinyl-tRNA synthetase